MPSFSGALGILKATAFPLDKITKLAKESREGDLKKNGVSTFNGKHLVADGGKQKHDCYRIFYTTKFQGYTVEYSYIFCPECKSFIDKKAVLFNGVENSCSIIKF